MSGWRRTDKYLGSWVAVPKFLVVYGRDPRSGRPQMDFTLGTSCEVANRLDLARCGSVYLHRGYRVQMNFHLDVEALRLTPHRGWISSPRLDISDGLRVEFEA